MNTTPTYWTQIPQPEIIEFLHYMRAYYRSLLSLGRARDAAYHALCHLEAPDPHLVQKVLDGAESSYQAQMANLNSVIGCRMRDFFDRCEAYQRGEISKDI